MGKRLVLLLLGVVVLALAMAPVALAATPQDIYDDFAADGKLDGNYTDQELREYLNNPTLDQYADPAIKDRLHNLISQMLNRDTFPFTGFQLLLAGVVAVALVGGGLGLRRLARN